MKRILTLAALAACCSAPFTKAFAATFTDTPIADAFVATGPTGNLVGNNYGGGGALAIAAPGLTNGEFQTVMKFDLSGTANSLNALYGAGQWSVQSVSLQLTASPHSNVIYNDVAAGLFGVSLMQNNSWVEGTGNASAPANNGITFSSLQGVYINNTTDRALGTFSFGGTSSGANSYALTPASDLVADILAGATLSLRLFGADSSISYLFSSRSTMPISNEPQLIITVVPEPGSLPLLGLTLGLLLWRGNRLVIETKLHKR